MTSIIRSFFLGMSLVCLGWPALAQVPAGERLTLINFYDLTDGPNWHNNSGWNGPVGTECSWFGVTCINNRDMGSVPARQQPQRHPAEQPVAIERAALSVAVGQSVVRADLERNGANDQSAVPVPVEQSIRWRDSG